jgi:hypothetical protein
VQITLQNSAYVQRLLSRLHAGSIKESAFLSVVQVRMDFPPRPGQADHQGFETIETALNNLTAMADSFVSSSVDGLLRSAPDLQQLIHRIRAMYDLKRSGESWTAAARSR